MMSRHYKLTWSNFDISSVTSIEDPIASGTMAVESFVDIYGPLLVTLDGRDLSSHMDFFFERSPCNSSILLFVDENAKLDFRDEAADMGLIPPMQEVMHGESADDKRERQLQEMLRRKAIEKQKLLRSLRTVETDVEKRRKMLMNAQKTLFDLDKCLTHETDPAKRIKLEAKISSITRMLATKSNSC